MRHEGKVVYVRLDASYNIDIGIEGKENAIVEIVHGQSEMDSSRVDRYLAMAMFAYQTEEDIVMTKEDTGAWNMWIGTPPRTN